MSLQCLRRALLSVVDSRNAMHRLQVEKRLGVRGKGGSYESPHYLVEGKYRVPPGPQRISATCNMATKVREFDVPLLFTKPFQTVKSCALMLPSTKAAVYWLIVVIGSFIHDFLPPPDTYFSNKRNVFNVYFVKLGWGWTLGLMIPFVTLTSYIYASCDFRAMLKQCSRLAVATFCWYFWVNLFVYIEELTGVCEGEETLNSKRECYIQGYHWEGFDISGHVFILMYSALVISEEIQVKKLWPDIVHYDVPKWTLTKEVLLNRHSLVTPFIEALFICVSLLLLLWELMLVCTSVYFHSVHQKVIGAIIALFTWNITYGLWFQYDHISPGLPWAAGN